MVGDLGLDAGMQGRARVPQAGYVKPEQERQHRRAFGEVEPLHVVVIVGRVRGRLQPAVAVVAQKVVDDGA